MRPIKAPIALMLSEGDDVAVLLTDGNSGDDIRVRGPSGEIEIRLTEDIPRHHKVALHALKSGTLVRRSATIIGVASSNIEAGTWVHIHNLRSLRANAEDRSNGA